MRLRLLGDVQAEVDGRLLVLGPARQQCVFVALLVDANRAVSTDQLIARVWGQRAPQRVRNSVHVYLSRLRQILTASDEVCIVRQTCGYRLNVDPLMVDLHQFQHLSRQARRADPPAAALPLLEQALQLWRGAAFANLDTPWLAGVREDLHRQRWVAELDRNDLALGLGRHTALLAELSAAAAAAPLDERLAGQLMLALYRSGRQADALTHYHHVRQRLVESIGADPGSALRELHQQILTADPALAVSTSATATRPATDRGVPRQLPAPPGGLAGRIDELARLDALLASTTENAQPCAMVVSTISGTAGIGKTALAVHWAHQVGEQFSDGQLYANLRGFDPAGSVLAPTAVIRGFLDALGVLPQRIPAGLDAQAALYRSLLADRRVLVVLDDARDTAQVRPLLPGAPGCVVLVTSRNQLSGLVADGAHPIALDLLSSAEASALLSQRIGADRVAAEPQSVQEIIDRCARLPLALAIVAARAALHSRFPLRALATELCDTGSRLEALTGDDPRSDLRAVLSWSYHTLIPETARLFRLLGLHPGPDVSAAAAASLAGLPPSQVRPMLAELIRANLITEHAAGRYTFHDLLRVYATDLAETTDSSEQRHAAACRMLDHYLHTACPAARLLGSTRDPLAAVTSRPGTTPEHPADRDQALAWFIAEHAVLLAAVDHATAIGLDTHTWQLTQALRTYLTRRGHWQDRITIGHAAVAAAQRLTDPTAQARAHYDLAHAYVRLSLVDDAHDQLRHALDLATQIGDPTEQANAHYGLAEVWRLHGHHARALRHAQQSLQLFRAAGHRRGLPMGLNAVGWYHAQLGDYQQAITFCRQALTRFQELDDHEGQAATWDSLGYAQHRLGQYDRAITSYRHALHLYRNLGHRNNEANTLNHVGDIHHAMGNHHAAHTSWQQSLTILDDLSHPDADQLRAKLATERRPAAN